jgi:hypothetical protein
VTLCIAALFKNAVSTEDVNNHQIVYEDLRLKVFTATESDEILSGDQPR